MSSLSGSGVLTRCTGWRFVAEVVSMRKSGDPSSAMGMRLCTNRLVLK